MPFYIYRQDKESFPLEGSFNEINKCTCLLSGRSEGRSKSYFLPITHQYAMTVVKIYVQLLNNSKTITSYFVNELDIINILLKYGR